MIILPSVEVIAPGTERSRAYTPSIRMARARSKTSKEPVAVTAILLGKSQEDRTTVASDPGRTGLWRRLFRTSAYL